jgi:hypothetical protein
VEYRRSSTKPSYSDESKEPLRVRLTMVSRADTTALRMILSLGLRDSVFSKKNECHANGHQQNSHPSLKADAFVQKHDSSQGSGNIT